MINSLLFVFFKQSCIIFSGFSLESFKTLLLEKDIFTLESHFKWMLELTSDDGPLDEKRILILKEKMLSWVAESDQHLSVFQAVAQKLLLAVYSGFLAGNCNEVAEYFKEAQEILDKAKENPEETTVARRTLETEQLRVYRYIKLCNQLLVTQCSDLLAIPKDGSTSTSTTTLEDLKSFVDKFTNVFQTDSSKATIYGMQGIFII